MRNLLSKTTDFVRAPSHATTWFQVANISPWSFLMRLLPFGIGLRNPGTRLAEPKTQMPKHTPALAYGPGNPGLPPDPSPPASCRLTDFRSSPAPAASGGEKKRRGFPAGA